VTTLPRQLFSHAPTHPSTTFAQLVILVGACLLAGGAGGILTAAVHPLAGFALLVGVGVGLGMLLNQDVGLLAFIGAAYLLPFAKIPLRIGVSLTFLDVILTVLLVTWLGRIVMRRDGGLVGSPVHPLVLVFLGLALTSFTLGIQSVTSEVFRLFLKLINSVLFFFILTNLVRERDQLSRLLRWTLWLVAAQAAIALVLYALSPSPAAQLLSLLRPLEYPTGPGVIRYIAGTQTLRAIGTSVDPNVLGGMLVLVLPLAIAFALAKDGPVRRRYVIAMVGLITLALLLTMSRGAWLGAVAGFALIATFRYRRLWFIAALGAAIFVLMPQSDQFVERFEAGVRMEDRATLMRLGEYKDALRLIESYPFFGVGFGAAPEVDLYIGASSVYLLIAEEMGLIGLGVFLITMGALYWYALGVYRKAPHGVWSTTILGCLAGVTGALVTGIFDHHYFNLYFPHSIALFWFLIGLTVIACRLAEAERRGLRTED
jgi:polysaccharide biosynthesis protein PslJ